MVTAAMTKTTQATRSHDMPFSTVFAFWLSCATVFLCIDIGREKIFLSGLPENCTLIREKEFEDSNFKTNGKSCFEASEFTSRGKTNCCSSLGKA